VVKDIIESYSAQLTLGDSPMGGAAFRIHFPVV
jgi:two-component system sensor histidine kinase PhoQ